MLQISNLSKTYANGVQALKDINLTIGKGMFGLLGQNGAGKSSLMRTLATLQDADQGQIFLGETNAMKEPEKIRRALGYLPQEFGVYDAVSAEDMLDYLAEIKGVTKRSEDVIVILSTHIVEDVTSLCSDMAIIGSGQVLVHASPKSIIKAVDGKIWGCKIERQELALYQENHSVIATYLNHGQIRIHVFSNEQPDSLFEPVTPDMEDAYFSVSYSPALQVY